MVARRRDIYWHRSRMSRRLVVLLFTALLLRAQPSWWTSEPIRWVQTNLRETDAAMDTRRLVGQLAAMRANVGVGGPDLMPFR